MSSALPRYIAAGTSDASTLAITPTIPTSCTAGTLMVMVLETRGDQSPPTITGWTQKALSGGGGDGGIAQGSGAGSTKLFIFYRRFVAGDTTPSISDTGDHQIAQIFHVAGASVSGDPFDVAAAATEVTSDTSVSVPSLVTSVNDCLILWVVGGGVDGSNPITWDSPATVVSTVASTAGNGGQFSVAEQDAATSGTYGPATATFTSATVKALVGLAILPRNESFFIDKTTANNTVGVTISPPTKVRAGDLMVLVVCTLNGQGITTPSGWAHVTGSSQESAGSQARLAVYTKTAVGGDTGITTDDSGSYQWATWLLFGNVLAVNTSTGGTTTASTSHTLSAVTTTDINTLIVLIVHQGVDGTTTWSGWTNANLTDLSERSQLALGGTPTASLAIETGRLAAAGSSGTTAVTSSASNAALHIVMALGAPAPASSGHSWAMVIG